MNTKNKVQKYIDGNTYFDIKTHRLHIYNGIITSPVARYEYENNYQKSYTKSGSVYITVPPTFVNLNK